MLHLSFFFPMMISHMLFPFNCLDPSLGRIDKSTLSQQTLMELLIEGITNKELVCGSAENPKDISEWTKVTLNQHGEVVEIQWSLVRLNGSLALQWLPATVRILRKGMYSFTGFVLFGTLDLTDLPESLEILKLSNNRFEGEISLTTLPKGMKHLNLSSNCLCGPLDLTSLPSTLTHLSLMYNSFEGVTDFSRLPESLEELYLTNNKELKGTISPSPSMTVLRTLGTKVKQIPAE